MDVVNDTVEFKTIGDFFRYALTFFAVNEVYLGHGTDALEDEAWWLIAGALQLPLDSPKKLFMNARLSPSEKEGLQALIYERGVEKVPTAYLLQEAYQQGCSFYVDERVLIPRSPIAELILEHFQPWIDLESIGSILDLCTGSGCLAILSALACPDAHIDAVDISSGALEVAEINVETYELSDQLELISSNLFEGVAGRKYDVILSNPPYVDQLDLDSMPAEYHHEPRLALEAGEDGLSIVRRILAEAPNYLNAGGLLIVEVGNSQAALEAAYPHLPFIWLEFQSGGEGVFLLRKEDLDAAR